MACNSSESAVGDYNRRVAAEGNNSSVRQQAARRRAALDVYSWASIYGAPETGDDYKRVLPRAALRYPGGGNGVQSDVTTERAESGFFLFLMVVALQDLSRTNTQEKLPPLVSPLSRRFYFGALQCKLWESRRPSCFIPSKSSTGPFPVGAIFLRRGAILNISPDLTALVRAGRE